MIEVINRPNELYYEDLNSEIDTLMRKLMSNCLSGNEAMNEDGDQSKFNEWCTNFDAAIIDWPMFSADNNSYLYKCFCHPKIDGWIQLNVFNKIFPNATALFIKNGTLSDLVMDELYTHVNKETSSLCNIEFEDCIEHLTTEDAHKKYQSKFNAIN